MNELKMVQPSRFWFSVILSPIFLFSSAQTQLPNTNIYLFDIDYVDNFYSLTHPKFLTVFNAAGYNNQPSFISESLIWITSDYGISGHTDLWELDVDNQSLHKFSQTIADEFSPGLQPGKNFITAVRIEPDSAKTQRLWSFHRDSTNSGQPSPEHLKGVGYYAWKNMDTLALFILGDPHQLVLMNHRNIRSDLIAMRVGRCFTFDEAGRLVFVQKVTDESWYLKYYQPETSQSNIIIKTPAGSEDFCLLPDGTFLMASGSVIMRYHPEKDVIWKPFVDLGSYGLSHMNRIVQYKGRRLAVVNQSK